MRANAVGWLSLVRGAFLAGTLDARVAPPWLGAAEAARWPRLATHKRREEFLSGRLAAKLALNAMRLAHGQAILPYPELDISVTPTGAPGCVAAHAAFSISHSRGTAVAFASRTSTAVGIDVEISAGEHWRLADMFHVVELPGIRNATEARVRWMLKEAWSKLGGIGLLGLADPPLVVQAVGRLWLVVPRSVARQDTAWIALCRSRGLTLAVAATEI
jgi:phosphopantetheinyl transferase